jgi:hypothetical protein
MDSNYRKLKTYNDNTISIKEGFELNSGFIQFTKETENSVAVLKASSSDITTKVNILTPTQRGLNPQYVSSEVRDLPATVVTNKRISFPLDSRVSSSLNSIDIFVRSPEGYWAPISQYMNQQLVQYDSATKQLHISKDGTALMSQVFDVRGSPMMTPDGTPLVRIIITW